MKNKNFEATQKYLLMSPRKFGLLLLLSKDESG